MPLLQTYHIGNSSVVGGAFTNRYLLSLQSSLNAEANRYSSDNSYTKAFDGPIQMLYPEKYLIGGTVMNTVKGSIGLGLFSGLSSLGGQYAYTGSLSKVDYAGVLASTIGGMMRNPWMGASFATLADATFDFDGQGNRSSIFTGKNGGMFINDLMYGGMGNFGGVNHWKAVGFGAGLMGSFTSSAMNGTIH